MTDADREAIRQERQETRLNMVAKLREQAANIQAEADAKMATFNHYRDDIAWLTQPAAGTAFGRKRDKIMRRYQAGLALDREARQLREQADRLEQTPPTVDGDRAAEREAYVDSLDNVVTVGMTLHCPIYGDCTVLKINRKTYRVQGRWQGSPITVEKHLFQLPKGA